MKDKEKYLSTTEFAIEYNRTRPIDDSFMPLEPSYVKFLCEQGHIRHSTLPAHDGRKKETIMIPESELDTVDILLNGDEAIEKRPAKTMTTKEVAAFLGLHRNNVAALVRQGKLKARKIHNSHGGHDKYEFDENDVIKYKEGHPKRHYTRRVEPKKDIPEPVTVDPDRSDEIEALNKTISDLRNTIKKLVFENADLKDRLNHASFNATTDKDIFDSYRRGFKDGFEMRGKE